MTIAITAFLVALMFAVLCLTWETMIGDDSQTVLPISNTAVANRWFPPVAFLTGSSEEHPFEAVDAAIHEASGPRHPGSLPKVLARIVLGAIIGTLTYHAVSLGWSTIMTRTNDSFAFVPSAWSSIDGNTHLHVGVAGQRTAKLTHRWVEPMGMRSEDWIIEAIESAAPGSGTDLRGVVRCTDHRAIIAIATIHLGGHNNILLIVQFLDLELAPLQVELRRL